MKGWVGAWGPAAAWAAFLFFISSRPSVGLDLSSGLDKVAHFGAYFVLGLLLARGVSTLALPARVAVALGVLYGLSDEIHQSFVPGRSAEIGDWVADALGTVAGVVLFYMLLRKRASRTVRGTDTALDSP